MATYGFFNASTPKGKRHDDRSTRERVGVVVRGRRAGRTPDAAAETFDDTPRERQRQAHAAAPIVERPRLPFVCLLYAPFIGHDHDRARSAVARLAAALGDDGGRTGLFAQNRPENRI